MDTALQQTLKEGESVVWAGPRLAAAAKKQSITAVLFGLTFTLFSALILYSLYSRASTSGKPLPVVPMLIVFPFLFVGLLFLFSPVLISQRTKRTFYAVTNKRALVMYLKKDGETVVHEYTPERLGNLTVRTGPHGAGDIIFQVIRRRVQGSGDWPEQRIFKGFLGVANVREVEGHLNALVASVPSN